MKSRCYPAVRNLRFNCLFTEFSPADTAGMGPVQSGTPIGSQGEVATVLDNSEMRLKTLGMFVSLMRVIER